MVFRRRPPADADQERLLHEEFVLASHSGRRRVKLRMRATDQAVHIRGPNLNWTLGYDSIAYVTSQRQQPSLPDRLELVAQDGSTLSVHFPKRDQGIGEIIEQRLAGLDYLEVQGEVRGVAATLTYHPWRRDQMSYWEYIGPATTEAEIAPFQAKARQEVLDHYQPTPVPPFKRTTDWLERDWTVPMTALAEYKGLPAPSLWTAGHEVAEMEIPVIIGVTDTHVYLAAFETLREVPEIRTAPKLMAYPFRSWADWELRSESEGRGLIRLLELQDHILDMGSLEEALKVKGAYRIRLLGLADPSKVDAVSEAVIAGVKRYGAYSPATRSSHPLQISSQ